MPLPVLALAPDRNGYTSKEGATVIAAQLDGGQGRYRADQLNASRQVTVQWTCNPKNFDYLMAFYRTAIKNGALPFSIDLTLDSHLMQTYVAQFVPDSFGLISQSGNTWVIGGTLEVIYNATYGAGDAAIIAAGPDA